MFTITGSPGSAHLTIAGEGSIQEMGAAAGAAGSSFLLVPDPAGVWVSANNNLGDLFTGGWTNFGSVGRELELTGDLRLEGTGSAEFSFSLDHLRFDDDVSIGGDDLDLRFAGTQSFPDYGAGITVAAEGSATFSLGDGNTFEDLIQGDYTLSGFGNGGTDSVTYRISQAVPEPSSFVLMGAVTAVVFRRRRPRRRWGCREGAMGE